VKVSNFNSQDTVTQEI